MKISVKQIAPNTTHLYDENNSLIAVFNTEDFFVITENRILAEYLYKNQNYELLGITGNSGSTTFVFVKKEKPKKAKKESVEIS
ncbi:MAG: hypothetical protein KatS3mg096_812 [Candidatus Parcubacteria bacterium]|nr:MAG: hypothetical protein KatS3mg096_812 [Candidatus Parcubacteria bacterium]